MTTQQIRTKFIYSPATASTDAEYRLCSATNGSWLNISIQDCRAYEGGYSVNRYGGEGADFYCEFVSEHRTLAAAKAAALRIPR